ncbi:MAG: SDR family oxidoreductase [Lentisphaeria bacterium]|nr:SDR family oxidoreductase [Lentisphaeria bacterium]
MQKILIFGGRGMLGHMAVKYLRQTNCYQVISCVRKSEGNDEISVDITDFAKVKTILTQQKPDIVLNCIGMLVKACAERVDQAILVNSYFPNYLAKLGQELNYKLIHVSTDCVFSGKRGRYYDSDFCDGDTPYARTKALGEVIDERNLTVRTSIIGPEIKKDGTGLFHWFMQQKGEISGYKTALWSGVTTLELSKFIHVAIQKNLTGLFQLSMPEAISKYDLLKLFQEIWDKRDVSISANEDYHCDKSMVCTQLPSFEYRLPDNFRSMLVELKRYCDEEF